MTFFDFLKALTENNNREWFAKNKNWYDSSKKDAEQIFTNCIDEIGKMEDLGNLTIKEAMFRIFRDVRFSKNKDPYKNSFSALIGKNGRKDISGFAYYLHFQPGECFMAAGLYEPGPDQLAKIRQEIDYNAAAFTAIISEPRFKNMFGEMQGKQLKTTPKGFAKDHPQIEFLRFTQFYFSTPFTEKEVLSPDFPKKLVEACNTINPFLKFLRQAVD